jgi:hypothetical protein
MEATVTDILVSGHRKKNYLKRKMVRYSHYQKTQEKTNPATIVCRLANGRGTAMMRAFHINLQ